MQSWLRVSLTFVAGSAFMLCLMLLGSGSSTGLSTPGVMLTEAVSQAMAAQASSLRLEFTAEVSSLKAQLATLQERLSKTELGVEEHLAKLSAEVDRRSQEVGGREARLAELEERLAKLPAEVDRRSQEVGGREEKTNVLKKRAEEEPKGGASAKKWWDRKSSTNFQHLDESFVRTKYAEWSETFLGRFDWRGKRALDYGIGGGYLGKVLFEQYHLGAYIGVDISEKSLATARRTLSAFDKQTSLLLTGVRFSGLKPDIFVSQQVIQHFPSIEYFEQFLENVDTSGAGHLMLHFRQAKDGNTVSRDAYNSGGGAIQNVAFALVTTTSFLAQRLPHYDLSWTASRYMSLGYNGTFSGWQRKV